MRPAAVIFDLFGTLVDIASLRTAAARFTADRAAFVATWREKQLGYAFAAAIMERYEDFDVLTERALAFAAARHGLGPSERGWERLRDEWTRVDAYGDAASALAALRGADMRCAVLTNGTIATARAALEHANLSAAVDVILSVDAVRTYKPDKRVYALATAHFGAAAQRLVFVTSNGWDATGAAEFGLRVVWCNRLAAPAETFGAAPARIIGGLGDLPAAIAALDEPHSG